MTILGGFLWPDAVKRVGFFPFHFWFLWGDKYILDHYGYILIYNNIRRSQGMSGHRWPEHSSIPFDFFEVARGVAVCVYIYGYVL